MYNILFIATPPFLVIELVPFETRNIKWLYNCLADHLFEVVTSFQIE